MQASCPKQYLPLGSGTILQQTLNIFLDNEQFSGVLLLLSPEDEYFTGLNIRNPKLMIANGGKERCDSVLNGLQQLSILADDDDWVLVHDAARPCLSDQDLQKLLDALPESDGAILAAPVMDTIKQATNQNAAEIDKTVDRSMLWRALTPQAFRVGQLRQALTQALQQKITVTDDASAMEAAGYSVKLVSGRSDNIKITSPEDLDLAQWILEKRLS